MQPQQRNLSDFTSEVLFLTGLSKTTTNEDIRTLNDRAWRLTLRSQTERQGIRAVSEADAAAKVQHHHLTAWSCRAALSLVLMTMESGSFQKDPTVPSFKDPARAVYLKRGSG